MHQREIALETRAYPDGDPDGVCIAIVHLPHADWRGRLADDDYNARRLV
jgi:hypothetical protein